MRAARREKLEKELTEAEAEFQAKLLAALKSCSAGSWGLFGQNDHLDLPRGLAEQAYANSGARDLIELGREIEELRMRLGIGEPFSPFARLLELRGRHSSNSLGEARLAQAWLKEFGE